MTLRQQYALIEFLVAFYADTISVRSFTPIFYEEHKFWLDESIYQPFAQHGLDGISFEDIQVLAKVYESERNDYLT